ncbi:acetyl xylanesterase [Colletotrichum tofieldiae]|nr:acetyl xylanesterase [Colletotrichum tofieldiae]GKT88758.1 acetyl xylanesterase [Colletotrichum tofieldiae]
MHHRLSLSAIAALVPLALAQAQQPCAPVNIIVARGSVEAQGAGLLGNIAKNASMQIPGSIITPLVYPAQLDPYPPSVAAGVANMTDLLNQQSQQCPTTKLVLMGYSQASRYPSRECSQSNTPPQGAQVSLDTLCGTSDGPNFNTTVAQAPMVGSKIAAVVLFGDPTFVANQSYAKGTSKKNGSLTSKFASFCDDADLFCASGQNLTVHLGYFQNQQYIAMASSFIVQNTQ